MGDSVLERGPLNPLFLSKNLSATLCCWRRFLAGYPISVSDRAGLHSGTGAIDRNSIRTSLDDLVKKYSLLVSSHNSDTERPQSMQEFFY